MSANTTLSFLATFDGVNAKTGLSDLQHIQLLLDLMDAENQQHPTSSKKESQSLVRDVDHNVKLPCDTKPHAIPTNDQTHHAAGAHRTLAEGLGPSEDNSPKCSELDPLLLQHPKYTATNSSEVSTLDDDRLPHWPRRRSINIGGRSPYSHIVAMQRARVRQQQANNAQRKGWSSAPSSFDKLSRYDCNSENRDDINDTIPKHDYVDRWLEKLYFRQPIVVPGGSVYANRCSGNSRPLTGRITKHNGSSTREASGQLDDNPHAFTSIVNVCDILPPRNTLVTAHSPNSANINDTGNVGIHKTSRQHRQLISARCEVFAEKVTEILRSRPSTPIINDTYTSCPDSRRSYTPDIFRGRGNGSNSSTPSIAEQICEMSAEGLDTNNTLPSDAYDGSHDISYITVSPVRMSQILHVNGLLPARDHPSNNGVTSGFPGYRRRSGKGRQDQRAGTYMSYSKGIPVNNNNRNESVMVAAEVARKIVDLRHDRPKLYKASS